MYNITTLFRSCAFTRGTFTPSATSLGVNITIDCIYHISFTISIAVHTKSTVYHLAHLCRQNERCILQISASMQAVYLVFVFHPPLNKI